MFLLHEHSTLDLLYANLCGNTDISQTIIVNVIIIVNIKCRVFLTHMMLPISIHLPEPRMIYRRSQMIVDC